MKKSKVKVRICLGTACFVQGGADLLLYNDFVDPAILAEAMEAHLMYRSMTKSIAELTRICSASSLRRL